MTESCQFLSTEWGNLAEWSGVFAGLVVGLAVGMLTRRTNQLAAAANRTSDAMAALESRREAEANILRDAEQRLILVSLASSIGLAYATTNGLCQILGWQGAAQKLADSEEVQKFVKDKLSYGSFRIPDSVRDRMHYLDFQLSAMILRAEGGLPLMRESLRDIARCTPDVRIRGAEAIKVALGNQTRELSVAWEACQNACREAGLAVGDPAAQANIPERM